MKTQLPKQLKILAHQYQLRAYKGVITDTAAGETNSSQNHLAVDLNQQDSAVLVTLFHEFNHAINSEWNHDHLEFVAQAYAQIFIDNPSLIKWLYDNYYKKTTAKKKT